MQAPAEDLRSTVQALSGRLLRCLEQLEAIASAEESGCSSPAGAAGDSWLQGANPARRISKVIHVDATGIFSRQHASRLAASMPGDFHGMHARKASALSPLGDHTSQKTQIPSTTQQDPSSAHEDDKAQLIPACHGTVNAQRPQVTDPNMKEMLSLPHGSNTAPGPEWQPADIPATQFSELSALLAEQGMDLDEMLSLLAGLDNQLEPQPGMSFHRVNLPMAAHDSAAQEPRITTGSQMAAELYDMLAQDVGSPRSAQAQQAGRSLGGESSGSRWGWTCCKSSAGATTSGDGTTEACSPRSAANGAATPVQPTQASTEAKVARQAVAVQVPSQPASSEGGSSLLQEAMQVALQGSPRAVTQEQQQQQQQQQVHAGPLTSAHATALHSWMQQQHQMLLTLMHAMEVGSIIPSPSFHALGEHLAPDTSAAQLPAAAMSALDVAQLRRTGSAAVSGIARPADPLHESSRGTTGEAHWGTTGDFSNNGSVHSGDGGQSRGSSKDGADTNHTPSSRSSSVSCAGLTVRSTANSAEVVGSSGVVDETHSNCSSGSLQGDVLNSHISRSNSADGRSNTGAGHSLASSKRSSHSGGHSMQSMHIRLPRSSSIQSKSISSSTSGSVHASGGLCAASATSQSLSGTFVVADLPGLDDRSEQCDSVVATMQQRAASGAGLDQCSIPGPLACEQSLSTWPTFLQHPDNAEQHSSLPYAHQGVHGAHTQASSRVSEASVQPGRSESDMVTVYAEIQEALAHRRGSEAADLNVPLNRRDVPADSWGGTTPFNAMQQYSQQDARTALYCYHNPVYRSRSATVTTDSLGAPASPLHADQLVVDNLQPGSMNATLLGMACMLHILRQQGRIARSTTHSEHAVVVPITHGNSGSYASWSESGMGDAPKSSVSGSATEPGMALESMIRHTSNASELQVSSGSPSRRSTYSAVLPGSLPPSYPGSRRVTGTSLAPALLSTPPATHRQDVQAQHTMRSQGGASEAMSDDSVSDDTVSVSFSQYSAGLPEAYPHALHSVRSTAQDVVILPEPQTLHLDQVQEHTQEETDGEGQQSDMQGPASPHSTANCASRRSTYSAHLPDVPPSHMCSQRSTAGGCEAPQAAAADGQAQDLHHVADMLQHASRDCELPLDRDSEGGASRHSLYSAVLPGVSASCLPSARMSEHSAVMPSARTSKNSAVMPAEIESAHAAEYARSVSHVSARSTADSSYSSEGPRGMRNSSLPRGSCRTSSRTTSGRASRSTADSTMLPSARTTEHDPVVPFSNRPTSDSTVLPGGLRTTQHTSVPAVTSRPVTASSGGVDTASSTDMAVSTSRHSQRSTASLPVSSRHSTEHAAGSTASLPVSSGRSMGHAADSIASLPVSSRHSTGHAADSISTVALSRRDTERSTGSQEQDVERRRTTNCSAVEGVPERLCKPPRGSGVVPITHSKAGSARHSMCSTQAQAEGDSRRASVGSATEGVPERPILLHAGSASVTAGTARPSNDSCPESSMTSLRPTQCSMVTSRVTTDSTMSGISPQQKGSSGSTYSFSDEEAMCELHDSLVQHEAGSAVRRVKRATEVSTCSTTSAAALPMRTTTHPLGRSPSRRTPLQPAQLSTFTHLHPAMHPCFIHAQQQADCGPPASPCVGLAMSGRATTGGGSCVSAVTDVLSSKGMCEVVVADGLYGSPPSAAGSRRGSSSSSSSSCATGSAGGRSSRSTDSSYASQQPTGSMVRGSTASRHSTCQVEAGSPVANRATSTSAALSKRTTACSAVTESCADAEPCAAVPSAAATTCDEDVASPRSTYSAHLPEDEDAADLPDACNPHSPSCAAGTASVEAHALAQGSRRSSSSRSSSSRSRQTTGTAANLPCTATNSTRVTAGSVECTTVCSTYAASLPDEDLPAHHPVLCSLELPAEMQPGAGLQVGMLADMSRASCSPRACHAAAVCMELVSSRQVTAGTTLNTSGHVTTDMDAVSRHVTADSVACAATCSTYAASLPDVNALTARSTDDVLPESLANMRCQTSSTYAASLPDAEPITCDPLQFSTDALPNTEANGSMGMDLVHRSSPHAAGDRTPQPRTSACSSQYASTQGAQAADSHRSSPSSTKPSPAEHGSQAAEGLQQALSTLLGQLAGSPAAGGSTGSVNNTLLADLGRALLAAVAPQHSIHPQNIQQPSPDRPTVQQQQQQQHRGSGSSSGVAKDQNGTARSSSRSSTAKGLHSTSSQKRSSSSSGNSSNRTSSQMQQLVSAHATAASLSASVCSSQQAGPSKPHAPTGVVVPLAYLGSMQSGSDYNETFDSGCMPSPVATSAWGPSSTIAPSQADVTHDASIGGSSTASAAPRPDSSTPAGMDPAAAAQRAAMWSRFSSVCAATGHQPNASDAAAWEAMWSRFSSSCAAAGQPVPQLTASDAAAWEAMWSRFSSRCPTAPAELPSPAVVDGGDANMMQATPPQQSAGMVLPGFVPSTAGAPAQQLPSAAAAAWNALWNRPSSTPSMSTAGSLAAGKPQPHSAFAPAAAPPGIIPPAAASTGVASPGRHLTTEEWSAMWSAWSSAGITHPAAPSTTHTTNIAYTERSSPPASISECNSSHSRSATTHSTAARSGTDTYTNRSTLSKGGLEQPVSDTTSLAASGEWHRLTSPSTKSGRASEPAYEDGEGSHVSPALWEQCRRALGMQDDVSDGGSSGPHSHQEGLGLVAGLLSGPGHLSPLSASSHHSSLCELLLRSLSRSGPYDGCDGSSAGGSTETGGTAVSAGSSDSRLLQLVLQIMAGQDEQAAAAQLQRVLASKSVQCSMAGTERGPVSIPGAAVNTTQPSSSRTTTSTMPLLSQHQLSNIVHCNESSCSTGGSSSDSAGSVDVPAAAAAAAALLAARVEVDSQARSKAPSSASISTARTSGRLSTISGASTSYGASISGGVSTSGGAQDADDGTSSAGQVAAVVAVAAAGLPAADAQMAVGSLMPVQQLQVGIQKPGASKIPAGPANLQLHRCSSTNMRPADSRPSSIRSGSQASRSSLGASGAGADMVRSSTRSTEDFHSPAASTPTLLSTGGAVDCAAHGESPASPASSSGKPRAASTPAMPDHSNHPHKHHGSDEVVAALQALLQQATAVMKARDARSCSAPTPKTCNTVTESVGSKLQPSVSNVSSLSGSSEEQLVDHAGLREALQACRLVAAAYRHLDKTARSTARPASSRMLAQLLQVQASKPDASDLLAHLPQAQRQAVLYCTFTAWRQLATARKHQQLGSPSKIPQPTTTLPATVLPAAFTASPAQYGAHSCSDTRAATLNASPAAAKVGSASTGGSSSSSSSRHTAHTPSAHTAFSNSGRITSSSSAVAAGQQDHTATHSSTILSARHTTTSSTVHFADQELADGCVARGRMAVAIHVSSQRAVQPLDSRAVLQGTSAARSTVSASEGYISASTSTPSPRDTRSFSVDAYTRPASAGRVRALPRPSVMVHDALMDGLRCRPSSASSRALGIQATRSVCSSASVTQTSMGGASDASGPRGTFSSVASSHGHAYRCSDGSTAGMVASRAGLCSPRSPSAAYP